MHERLDEHVRRPTREDLARALTDATDRLMEAARAVQAEPFRRAVTAALECIAEAAGADAAQAFQFCEDPFGGDPVACRRFYWTARGAKPSEPPGYGRWKARLQARGPICQPTADFPASERRAIEASGAAFVTVVPVRVDGALWGGLRFDASEEGMSWSSSEARLLEAVAENFGLAIDRPLEGNVQHELTRFSPGEAPGSADAGGEAAPRAPSAAHDPAGRATPAGRPSPAAPPDVLAIVSATGRILHQDAAFTAFVGHPKDAINEAGGLPVCIAQEPSREDVAAHFHAGTAFQGTVQLNTTGPGCDTAGIRVRPVRDKDGTLLCSLCWLFASPDTDSQRAAEAGQATEGAGTASDEQVTQYTVRLRERVRAEQALVQASQLLMASSSVDMQELLHIIGEATGAHHAYLVTIAPEPGEDRMPARRTGDEAPPPIDLDAYEQFEWDAPGSEEATDREHAPGGEETPGSEDTPGGEAAAGEPTSAERPGADVEMEASGKADADGQAPAASDGRYASHEPAGHASQDDASQDDDSEHGVSPGDVHAGDASEDLTPAGDSPGSTKPETFAVPIISSDDQLFGYLGIEHAQDTSPLGDHDARVLNVLGDMICTYLQRQLSEQALRKSERRYRHFVDTISEAIWRVEIDPPLDGSAPKATQVRHLMNHGRMAECNTETARLFGVDAPEQLTGRSVRDLLRGIGPKLVEDLVEHAFGLRHHELAVRDATGAARHFVISTTGVVQGDRLERLWGSSTEVTDRVELERRMVTALEEQQRRIGQDLHDNVGQLLTGVRMLSQNIGERHFEEGSPGHAQIQKVVKYAAEAAQHVSDLQRGLMPVQMERAGLAQALQELAGNTNVFPDVECIYIHDEATDVSDHEVKLQLYRIAQEATNNALKHAEPSYIKIVLKRDGEHVLLQVEDDGQGFDVDAAQEKSLGLHSMHYRARSISAALDIDSEPGRGTVVQCEVPLREVTASPEA